jgi:hypothetical protein
VRARSWFVSARAALALAAVLLAGGCQTLLPAPQPDPPASESIALLYARPAERALINGLRAYEEGAFERAALSA